MHTLPKTPPLIILALASAVMIGPFSLDTYLPAFPAIAAALEVDEQAISLSVSVYIISLALGQLVGGALSDRFGRKSVLFGGLGLFAVTSLFLAQAQTLNSLLLGRAVQAFGAGWALVSVPALVRDRLSGQEAAKLFSMMGLIAIIAPAIAPSIGSLLLKLGPWQLVFYFLAFYAVLIMPLLAHMFATWALPPPARSGPQIGFIARYVDVLSNRAALPFIGWQVGCFSIVMIFISHASFIYQGHFGLSEDGFALFFALNIVAMMGFNLTNRALLARLQSVRILRMGTVLQAASVLVLVVAAALDSSLVVIVLLLALSIGSVALIGPNIQACFLEHFPTSGGTAAALMGASQFGFAGIISAFTALLPHTITAMFAAMLVCAAGNLFFMWRLQVNSRAG
ncbi:MAG: Bcr/CflA family efflux MFS transporter [Spongiibacteraceae bacterium]|jgi:DHA1 family bicyclomycin/chloramphenicol resistance-like MFS transporter|nr:Bcr/CflA family efflux MFS transporter [Spongiibacteraceae bacterium]